ncbi:MAG: DUF262 domain-containing protein [Parabacteroides sp.]|nr:DUF262 domain-containing protein [Parabacteroides sp.]
MLKFKLIPQFTKTPGYKVDVFMEDFENRLERDIKEHGLNLYPDFQRGHVWTEEQQIRYIEYILRGGESGRDFYFNHPGWFRDWKGEYVCVDGLQRITAILRFLKNEIPVFGHYRNEYEDSLPFRINFHWHVNDLINKEDVLIWYLEMNEGGTPHTKEELDRVRSMIKND